MKSDHSKIIDLYDDMLARLAKDLMSASDFYNEEYKKNTDNDFLKTSSESYKDSSIKVKQTIKIIDETIEVMGWKK